MSARCEPTIVVCMHFAEIMSVHSVVLVVMDIKAMDGYALTLMSARRALTAVTFMLIASTLEVHTAATAEEGTEEMGKTAMVIKKILEMTYFLLTITISAEESYMT